MLCSGSGELSGTSMVPMPRFLNCFANRHSFGGRDAAKDRDQWTVVQMVMQQVPGRSSQPLRDFMGTGDEAAFAILLFDSLARGFVNCGNIING